MDKSLILFAQTRVICGFKVLMGYTLKIGNFSLYHANSGTAKF